MKKLVTILGTIACSSIALANQPIANGCSTLANQATLAIAQLDKAASISPKTRVMVFPTKTTDEASFYTYTFESFSKEQDEAAIKIGEYTTQVVRYSHSGACAVGYVKSYESK